MPQPPTLRTATDADIHQMHQSSPEQVDRFLIKPSPEYVFTGSSQNSFPQNNQASSLSAAVPPAAKLAFAVTIPVVKYAVNTYRQSRDFNDFLGKVGSDIDNTLDCVGDALEDMENSAEASIGKIHSGLSNAAGAVGNAAVWCVDKIKQGACTINNLCRQQPPENPAPPSEVPPVSSTPSDITPPSAASTNDFFPQQSTSTEDQGIKDLLTDLKTTFANLPPSDPSTCEATPPEPAAEASKPDPLKKDEDILSPDIHFKGEFRFLTKQEALDFLETCQQNAEKYRSLSKQYRTKAEKWSQRGTNHAQQKQSLYEQLSQRCESDAKTEEIKIIYAEKCLDFLAAIEAKSKPIKKKHRSAVDAANKTFTDFCNLYEKPINRVLEAGVDKVVVPSHEYLIKSGETHLQKSEKLEIKSEEHLLQSIAHQSRMKRADVSRSNLQQEITQIEKARTEALNQGRPLEAEELGLQAEQLKGSLKKNTVTVIDRKTKELTEVPREEVQQQIKTLEANAKRDSSRARSEKAAGKAKQQVGKLVDPNAVKANLKAGVHQGSVMVADGIGRVAAKKIVDLSTGKQEFVSVEALAKDLAVEMKDDVVSSTKQTLITKSGNFIVSKSIEQVPSLVGKVGNQALSNVAGKMVSKVSNVPVFAVGKGIYDIATTAKTFNDGAKLATKTGIDIACVAVFQAAIPVPFVGAFVGTLASEGIKSGVDYFWQDSA